MFKLILKSFKSSIWGTYLKPVIGPAAKLHDAGLLVEGEVLDVHLARRVIDRRRLPLHLPGGHQGGLGGQRHLEVAVSAETYGELFKDRKKQSGGGSVISLVDSKPGDLSSYPLHYYNTGYLKK